MIRALFANCRSQADIKTAATWGNQFNRVLTQQELDFAQVRAHARRSKEHKWYTGIERNMQTSS
jgi:hypothetical protein